jgi:hypothetical protein
VNYLLFPTLLIAVALFLAGVWLASRTSNYLFSILCALGALLAIPGVLFAIYYLKLLHNSVWYYEFRSIPYTELTASGTGFLAGLLHQKLSRNAKFRRIAGCWFFPGVLGLGLLIPHIKPMVRPINAGFTFRPDLSEPWPFPAIAGVRLPQSGNTGHFITILDHQGDRYVLGDPLDGITTQSQSDLRDAYDFTGFFMVVE